MGNEKGVGGSQVVVWRAQRTVRRPRSRSSTSHPVGFDRIVAGPLSRLAFAPPKFTFVVTGNICEPESTLYGRTRSISHELAAKDR